MDQHAPNWQLLLAELKKRGWRQVQIAERAGVVQATVSKLARGSIREPAYSVGAALLDLHRGDDCAAVERT
jgi:transcriptional regulator with XRE-family HTH domain